ncbi:MAG: hypothetical protein JW818_23240 [Pirellulales bacterium]|nr:hypothetical protein [Pirellulales bacterium]
MPISALSARSGVPKTTVKRILGDGFQKAAFANVDAVAKTLGMSLKFEPILDVLRFEEQQARKKAERIVALVHGSSALESQAAGKEDLEAMLDRTVHELMAGSERKLWAT